MSEITIRPGLPADLEEMVALERGTTNAPHWPRQAYDPILEISGTPATPVRCCYVAVVREKLAGFSVGYLAGGEVRSAELESVVVAEPARRKGIGRMLCRHVLEWSWSQGAIDVSLEVRAGSAAAIALYTSVGFEEIARRPGYYRDPTEDAMRMTLRLDRASLGFEADE